MLRARHDATDRYHAFPHFPHSSTKQADPSTAVWPTLRAQIEFISKPFPAAAMDYAHAHRTEVAPHLIQVLTDVVADPAVRENPDYCLHLYAIHLLAIWRDTAAYLPLMSLGALGEETVDLLLGDHLTESYGRCLAAVCDGNVAPLRALFENEKAFYWARDEALKAMAVRVLEGDGSREELIAYLVQQGDMHAARLRAPGVQRESLEVLDAIATTAAELGAAEMQERVMAWFEADLLDLMMVDPAWMRKHITLPFDTCKEIQLHGGHGYPRDMLTEVGWWSFFKEDKPPKHQAQALASPKQPKIGRNDPCPCGSGKKYKKCHG